MSSWLATPQRAVLRLLSIVFFTLGIQGAASASELQVIRIASPDLSAGPKPFAGTSTVSLAHIRGALEQEFAKDGIKIEWSFFKGAGPAVNEALANRQIDFAYLGDLASIIGRAGGVQTRLLLAVRGSNTYLGVPPDSSIATLKDLKGKRVALFRGTGDELAFVRALAEAGLTERDMQIINLDWTAARAALASRQVDAAWQSAGLLILRDRGQIKVPFSTKLAKSRQVTTQSGLIGTQEFITAHADLTQRLINVLVAQAQWASDPAHRDQWQKLFSEQGGLPLALVQGEYQDDDLRFRFNPRLDEFVATSYGDSVAKAKSFGLIRRDFDVRAWQAPQFVEQAIAAQHSQDYWPSYDARGVAIKR
ncbi:ABC transporter substrate-binding protein [Herbaspirillum rubrisubalbicans]|uniref:ABC transporter substrate-binding protein n=1 Tax=Herbaspirillum rubrisubalbicans TaxID=80842 RepID=UPI000DD48DDA|nr:ABC transporter substrate-binding protein [Herbaspirillum rubrisubalbicans]